MGSFSDERRGRDSRSCAPRDGRGRPSAPKTPQRRPRQRIAEPLSSQESYDSMRRSRASYERARASRDVLDEARRAAGNREVIDGRGSIDSRTFNESHQISAYSRDDCDRPDPMLDTVSARTSWRSRAGQGFDAAPEGGMGTHGLPLRPRSAGNVGFSGGVMSGRADYGAPAGPLAGIPLFLKVTIPIIVILLIVILVLVFFK